MNTIIEEERILYADEQCVAVNKRCGEACEGTEKGMVSLPALLEDRFGGPITAVHRLDVPASGCVLFARTPKALAFLNKAFASGKAQKYYWAVIEMPPPELNLAETGELIHWLIEDKKRNKSIAYGEEGPSRRKGQLRYRIAGRGERYLFLEIELISGRHHQIRAQLAALGLRIRGDLKYGAKRSEKTGGIRLHARSLRFDAPWKKEQILVTAAPPLRDRLWEDFEKLE
ncbi:ribosomal large subunit pseudouridine synthase family protein [Treponema primitia ZAS-2]|uniref:Ribosomal large subunit pseudouridine synthase family protein n=1 Tax=Treponema primitia (strain ATCC BAA-887 / DSM 12427 / ZAS-2) TaxID=545694 RepID=F5YGV9_TREPZ|nr:RNA pseudouridine synthase [Treponema primitia]AEF85854.1 ribosomal large subunit pseudouridine synthase family protein [Treponema primitia ZAS-2]